MLLSALIILTAVALARGQTYQNLTTITGAADQSSSYFNIPSSEWRYEWSYTTSAPTYAALYVDVYAQGNDLPVDSMMASTGQTSGTEYMHNSQPGSYYIKVSAANLDSYTITVETQAAATNTPAPTPTTPEYPATAILISIIAAVTVTLIVFKKHQTTL